MLLPDLEAARLTCFNHSNKYNEHKYGTRIVGCKHIIWEAARLCTLPAQAPRWLCQSCGQRAMRQVVDDRLHEDELT